MRQIDFKWKWQQEITAMQNLPTVWARSTRSSEVELLIWNRSSWNLTHFKGRTYQAEELESSQEAGTQAWTAKCWRRLDELCTSSYSWCWRIDESVHIRLGGGTCHSFRFGSIDKLMIWNDSSSLWHVMTNKVEFHASKAEHSQCLLLLEFWNIFDSCASEQMTILCRVPLS